MSPYLLYGETTVESNGVCDDIYGIFDYDGEYQVSGPRTVIKCRVNALNDPTDETGCCTRLASDHRSVKMARPSTHARAILAVRPWR